jgi:hypothetical protein
MSPRWTVTPSWKRVRPPRFITPCLPALVDHVPAGPGWHVQRRSAKSGCGALLPHPGPPFKQRTDAERGESHLPYSG